MTNLNEYLSKDYEILYLIKQAGALAKKVEEKDLSKILIALNEKGYLLTNITQGLDSLMTPYLKIIMDDFKMYSFISDDNTMTAEGLEQFSKHESELDSAFKETASKIIKNYYTKKK